MPKSLRRNPFAHDYFKSVKASVLARAKLNKDPTAPSDNEDDVTCVICMNFIHYEVDEHGGLQPVNSPSAATQVQAPSLVSAR